MNLQINAVKGRRCPGDHTVFKSASSCPTASDTDLYVVWRLCNTSNNTTALKRASHITAKKITISKSNPLGLASQNATVSVGFTAGSKTPSNQMRNQPSPLSPCVSVRARVKEARTNKPYTAMPGDDCGLPLKFGLILASYPDVLPISLSRKSEGDMGVCRVLEALSTSLH